MPIAPTTTAVIDPGNTYFYVEQMLRAKQPYLLHDRFGRKLAFKSRSGLSIKLRQYDDFAVATTPTTEGYDPTPAVPSKQDFVAQLKQYKNWVEITDVLEATNIESVRAEVGRKLGENMGKTIDSVYRDYLVGGTSVYRAGGVASRNLIATGVSTAELRKIDRTMLGDDARYFTAIAKGDTATGTTPVLPAFYCLMHTDCKKDVAALTEFQNVSTYAGQTEVMESEIGVVENFRFVVSSNAKIFPDEGYTYSATYKSTSGSYNDVYPILIFGQDAYAYCPLDALNVSNIVKDFDSGGPENPTNSIMSIAWKAMTTVVIYHQLYMTRYEVLVTA